MLDLTLHPTGAVRKARPGKRALLVGINAYRRQPLRGCLNDVAAIHAFLVSERGFAARDITVLVDGEATRQAILAQLEALAAVSKRGDALVFYFCGHGAQLPTADPYELDFLDEVICPVDFDWTPETAIIDDQLRAIFDSIVGGVFTTWVFDACHSGDLDDGLDSGRVTAEGSRVGPRPQAHPNPAAGVLYPPRTPLAAPHGVILSACASHERAADICVDGEAHGAFSYYLLRAVRRTPRAPLLELLASVRAELAAIGQHPEAHGLGLGAPFFCTKELNVNPKEPRTIMIANQPSLDADRHLHVYLAEASRRAQLDVDFGARLTELGVDLSGISEENAVALARAVKPGPRGEGLVCRTFWWGFHLEIPSAEVEELASLGISHATLVRMLEVVPHRMAPHLGTLVEYITENFETIKCTDRGVGVLISMSSFAPDLYVVTAAPSRHAARRSSEPSDLCVVRM